MKKKINESLVELDEEEYMPKISLSVMRIMTQTLKRKKYDEGNLPNILPMTIEEIPQT